MRLTQTQQLITKSTVERVLGTVSRVWLFGSRADDTLRGGDIDLLIETDALLPNRAKVLCKLHGALTFALGDRKLDILLKDARTHDAPIFDIAKRTGVIL
ncbi:MAG: nucleotidyltransferase domain-containing protein [Gallionella sp.]|nr:nucleotidyltransferase domain-containing protein [Gallionella sp.]